jgi:hypothetical protein
VGVNDLSVWNPELVEPGLPRLELGPVDDPEGEVVQAGPVLVEAVVPVGCRMLVELKGAQTRTWPVACWFVLDRQLVR